MLRIRLSTNEDMVPIGPARRRQEFVSPGPSHQPVLTLAAGVRADSLAGMAVSGWRSSREWADAGVADGWVRTAGVAHECSVGA